MTRTSMRAVAAAAALGAVIAAAPASALTIRNCTGAAIKVAVYGAGDLLHHHPDAIGKIGPGETASFPSGRTTVSIRVYRAQIVDRLILQRGNIAAGKALAIRATGAGYRARDGASCKAAR